MTALTGLSDNLILLFALTFLYGFVDPRIAQISRSAQTILKGLVFGTFGVISMMTPVEIMPGLFYDGRTIVICIAGIYGGPLSAGIAVLMVSIYRLSLGGIGVPAALASAVTAALLGVALHAFFEHRETKPHETTRKLITFTLAGAALAVMGIGWLLLLLPSFDLGESQNRLISVLILYPLAMLLLGTLLDNQQRSAKTKQALIESERRFRAVFDSSFQFIGLLHPDGTLIGANRAALEFGGIPLETVVGQPLWETPWWKITPETQAQLRELIARAAQGEFIRYQVEVWDAEKRPTMIDFSLKPIRDEAGQIVLLIPEARDISEHKQLEQQKVELALERERSSLLKKFLSDISHDFKTPLSVIRLNIDLLRRTVAPPEQRRLEMVAAQEQHLTRLLNDMMVMVRLDDAQTAFKFKPLEVNSLVQLVYHIQQSAALRKKQKLVITPAPNDLLVEADQVELERALANVITNGLTYTPEDGTITVTPYQVKDCVVIEIRDNGIGIAADELTNIFQRFYRSDQARSMDTGGTGLGLPIARKIVEAHRGSIEVESTLGAGSTFRIVLPLLAGDMPPAGEATNKDMLLPDRGGVLASQT